MQLPSGIPFHLLDPFFSPFPNETRSDSELSRRRILFFSMAGALYKFRYLQPSKLNFLFQSSSILCLRYSSSTRRFEVGEKAEISRVFSKEDVDAFARLTGDFNPIHLDSEFAKHTKFGRCIVHGALVNG